MEINVQSTKKERINYEKIIAGILLNLKIIDNIDFSLLIADFEAKTNIEVRGLWYDTEFIHHFIKCNEDGTILFKDGITLDYFIEEENCTLKDKLRKIAGTKVTSYFDNFNLEAYEKEKARILSENKTKVLNSANILLISDIKEDYDALVKYGFKNIDYFKSIIRADQYFSKHPEELEKYHLILKGNQNVQRCCFEGNVELDKILNNFIEVKGKISTSLNRHDYSDRTEFTTYLSDQKNHKSWDNKELTYIDLFDRIVENMLINHTLEKVDLKDKKYEPIKDYINPQKLPLPEIKADLKILYLDSGIRSEYSGEIEKLLGLNITFKEDNNYSLGRYVKSNLGNYDIIIVSNIYSGNILGMNHESTEQCKDTGRNLTLLVTHDNLYYGVDSELGEGIELKYVYGGSIAPDYELHNKETRIINRQFEEISDNKYIHNKVSQVTGILEAAVSLYNQALINADKPEIIDLDFKTAEELDQEYVRTYEIKEAQRQAELAPIRNFDNIRWIVLTYLSNKKRVL